MQKIKELNKINALKRIELINSLKSKLTSEEVKYLREFVYAQENGCFVYFS